MNEEKIRELRSHAKEVCERLKAIVSGHVDAFRDWVLAKARETGVDADEVSVRYRGGLREWLFVVARKKDGTDAERVEFGSEVELSLERPYPNVGHAVRMGTSAGMAFDASNRGQVVKYALAGMLALNLQACTDFAMRYEADTRELADDLDHSLYKADELERIDAEIEAEAKAKEAEKALKVGDWYASDGNDRYAYEIAKVTPCYVYAHEYKRYDYFDRKPEWWPTSTLGRLSRFDKGTFLRGITQGWRERMPKPSNIRK